MKLLLTSILTLIAAPALFADVAIYSGSAVVKATGADSGTTVSKLIEIVDLASGQSQSVTLLKKGSSKTFTVQPALATTLNTVTDSKNKKSYAVLSLAETTTDATSGVVSTASILFKGQVSSLSIKTGPVDSNTNKPTIVKSTVAKQFQGVSSLVTSAGNPGGSGAASLVIATPVLNLDAKLSTVANDAGHVTVAAALEDVKASLVAAGYSEAQ